MHYHLARKNRFKKVRNRLNKVESWKHDLETVLAEGWSGHSQTNQLLKGVRLLRPCFSRSRWRGAGGLYLPAGYCQPRL